MDAFINFLESVNETQEIQSKEQEVIDNYESIDESKSFDAELDGEKYTFTLKEIDKKGTKSYNVIKEGSTVETLMRFRSKDIIIKQSLDELERKKQFMPEEDYKRLEDMYKTLPNSFFGRLHGYEFHDEYDMIKKFGKQDVENLVKKLK